MNIDQETLQVDQTDSDETSDDELSANDAGSASANDDNDNDDNNDDDGEKEPVKFDERQQEVFDREIGKKVGATREAERENEKLRAQLTEVQAKLPIEQRPVIADMPDPYAENYNELMAARDKQISDAAAFDANQEALKTQKADLDQQNANRRMQSVQTAVNDYSARAVDLGITPDELNKAGQVLAASNVSDDVTLHILNDDKGPAITKYLAQNPLALDKLHGMTPMQAAVHLETVVKPVAMSSKNLTSAPPPSTNLDGGGSPPLERGPKGATFS